MNKYSGVPVFVKCGKCQACIQEKLEYQRILMLNTAPDTSVLFVTLTYNEDSVPYVSKSSFNDDEIKVFRGFPYVHEEFLLRIKNPLDIHFFNFSADFSNVKILFYEDVKRFIKRLRDSLQRSFIRLSPYSYTGEYGCTTLRPHFHFLFFLEDFSQTEYYISAIRKAWKFCDWDKLPQDQCFKIVPSKSVSDYVSTYLTCSSDLPCFLQIKEVSPKIRHCKFFGSNLSYFSFDSFYNNAKKGLVLYTVKESSSSSLPKSFLYPKYIVDRYFPKFKGYSRLNYYEILYIVKQVLTYGTIDSYFIDYLEYNSDDIHRLLLVARRYKRSSQELGIPIYVFLDTLFRFFNTLSSFLIKHNHVDNNGASLPLDHLVYAYDNLTFRFRNYTDKLKNPNYFPDNINKHIRLLRNFHVKKHIHIVKSKINTL